MREKENDKYVGKKYGKWTVVDWILTEKGVAWMCECECGRVKKQKVWNVKSGRSMMCKVCSVKERRRRRYESKEFNINN